MDLRVVKTIPIMHERVKLQFGAESFNLLDHTNPLRVSQFYSAGGARLGSYGQLIETVERTPSSASREHRILTVDALRSNSRSVGGFLNDS
jgi:hypothetical protein